MALMAWDTIKRISKVVAPHGYNIGAVTTKDGGVSVQRSHEKVHILYSTEEAEALVK